MAGGMKGPLDNGHLEAIAALVRSVMPQHTVYAEPWFREGEVFFLKQPSRRELLNDPDERMVNFYMTVRTQWRELLFLIESTLHSETLSDLADDIFFGRRKMENLYRAWSVWLRYNRERVNKNAWMVDTSTWLAGYREEAVEGGKIDSALAARLENVMLTARGIKDFITLADSPETFFWFRPTDRKEANVLLTLLPDLKGTFCFWYPDRRIAEKVAEKCSLNRITDDMGNTIYANFKIQKTLFDK